MFESVDGLATAWMRQKAGGPVSVRFDPSGLPVVTSVPDVTRVAAVTVVLPGRESLVALVQSAARPPTCEDPSSSAYVGIPDNPSEAPITRQPSAMFLLRSRIR